MPSIPGPATEGSKTWSPEHLFDTSPTSSETWQKIHTHLNANEFRAAIATAFELPPDDNFTYHASASVNLAQVEAAIHAGRANGLHAWYVQPATRISSDNPDDKSSKQKKQQHEEQQDSVVVHPGFPSLQITGYPPATDIQAYVSIFDPTKSAANSLKSLSANAKKGSLRASIAEYLLSKRYLDPSIAVPKVKVSSRTSSKTSSATQSQQSSGGVSSPSRNGNPAGHLQNPALDFWAYSCLALEYAGPNATTSLVKASHHMLPVYMHHFGCVVPSYEALQIIKKLAAGRRGGVIDMGSGNGYWTFMLRRLMLLDGDGGGGGGSDAVPPTATTAAVVAAVDNGQSRWRTTWISDTVVADGVQYLRRRSGCPDAVLLLVYPIVGGGGGGGEFTRKVLDAYTGDVIVVAGTQNGNGYTGFKDVVMDEYMSEHRPGWEKVAAVPLPSFAGKDDALFAFRRKKT
ncbi:hypothetical protein PV08_09919 [Exophiala spinifera]|uniref:Uncharacterized protein n=1 Tax=Exophiala spinifera TaxID=91928 RepID=A0A0D1YCJ0_9EURO|nr:uncharacterized protein PV08_09919 [Exophiala spinifera]KIW12641.1 hypothetical protein PV08_09919 [Exophiala spinifera]